MSAEAGCGAEQAAVCCGLGEGGQVVGGGAVGGVPEPGRGDHAATAVPAVLLQVVGQSVGRGACRLRVTRARADGCQWAADAVVPLLGVIESALQPAIGPELVPFGVCEVARSGVFQKS